ncbi:hypothetical protein [Kitasatospora sp. A2-31]|uniref:hypothetical protein n=1 Tax=Kitasatospora sp. A2-31 TaxID=2916414 RepID=UPI001EE93A6D|nr:hypothetical protein [Kitasatospora sp. A2-31]MCG6493601.1 hypothetical protein [Kitasatospora sp. A2-31]
MDENVELPQALRPPAGGEPVEFIWKTQIGPNASIGELAMRLKDLETAVQLGARWGLATALAASRWQLSQKLSSDMRKGRTSGAGLGEIFSAWTPLLVRERSADLKVLNDLGSPIRVRKISYGNPLQDYLDGSGYYVAGAIAVLRMVRDWSGIRRARDLKIERDEILNEALKWLVSQKQNPVPPGDLLALIREDDASALDRLAADEVDLELPADIDGFLSE